MTRILRAKAQLSLHKNRTVHLDALAESFARPTYAKTSQDIADRGVTLLRDEANILPLSAAKPQRLLMIAIAGDPDRSPAETLENELRRRVDDLAAFRCDTHYNPVERLRLPDADSYDVMIVALVARYADRKGSVSLPAEQIAALRGLLACGKPVIVTCIGNPYLVGQFPEAKTWLGIFGVSDAGQRAAARAIFGEIAIDGRIPVSVPGALQAGSGVSVPQNSMRLLASPQMEAKLSHVYSLLDRAVTDGAFPGGVIAVGHQNGFALHAFGKMASDANSSAVQKDTIYDAASLTKPVVTATLAGMLAEAGQLDVAAPIGRYLPEWLATGDAKQRLQVTVRHLLTHTSGLPAHREYFKSVNSRRELIAHALAEPLETEPGAQSVYSDVGFILQGEILQRLSGRHLDQSAQDRIFAPLGMSATMFNPPLALRDRIAPTEYDAVLRQRVAHGEVHDENCWAMGGVGGHAGLFSTAGDLGIFCQAMLNGGVYAHHRILKRKTVRQFTTAEPFSGNTRTLGWMVPTPGSSSGRYFSSRSFGHTGFTGTSMWIDPDRELFVVLLTNRVNPTRANDKFKQVRPVVHDAIVEALGLAKS